MSLIGFLIKYIQYTFEGSRPDYWMRLRLFHLYSLERRRERYMILYMVKIINGHAPNPGIRWRVNARTGYHIELPQIPSSCPAWVSKLRRRSLLYRGPQLFNCLPIELRSETCVISSQECFKSQLDTFLQTIPDQPTVAGCAP